jgi:iron complex outermembrane receptor protein
VPDYNTYGFGAFVYLKKTWETNTLNGGLRYDYRSNTGKELFENGLQRFTPFTNSFSNISTALGYTHQFNEEWNFKSNAGTAFRAPNPAELASNGIHEGSFRYEKGNPNLSPERSYQIDASIEFEGKTVSANASIYNNYIHNYIYASNLNNEQIFEDGNNYPVYRYGQVDANLYGAEASLTFHPVPYIHFENTFGYTHAQNTSLNKPLPFIPAGSLRNELRFEPKIKKINDAFLSVGIANFFRQERVDPEFEILSAGYTLLNAGVGATFNFGKQPVKLAVTGNNLLNKKYYDALSRLKPGRLDQTDPTIGVYNPGRNITFGLFVPISFGKPF